MTLHELRAHLVDYRRRSLGAALVHVALSSTVYAAAFGCAVSSAPLVARIASALVAGLCTGNLFMIGHDACHGSFTGSPRLNRILGRLAFLPCYHPYSLWERSHNRIHHVYTNLKGHDFVWTPLSKAEFDALPAWRRAAYRGYRTPIGMALQYGPEVWWPWVMAPRLRNSEPKLVPRLDQLLVVAFLGSQAAAMAAAGCRTLGEWALAGALGVLVPWLVFSAMIGFVIYFNHTHPAVPWFRDRSEWAPLDAMITGTVRLRFPEWTRFFASRIMDHVAHHVEPRIPLVRLTEAQERIEELLPGHVVVEPWSVRALLDIVRKCKLYDFDAHRWVDYQGRPTTPSLIAAIRSAR
jgi:omega-6 fatty acid desaturase (delta-12 desaturase)